MITLGLTILDFGMILVTLYMAYESSVENEQQAVVVSMLGAVFHVALLYVILYLPAYQVVPLGYFGAMGLLGVLFLVPRAPNAAALKGIRGYVVGDPPRPDQRDVITTRYRLVEGTEAYEEYYSRHPEREEIDRKHRKLNRIDGNIDDGYPPNVEMINATFSIPRHMRQIAFKEPTKEPYDLSPEKATLIAKNFAQHLGASLVGVCKVDPLCMYTNQRTEWSKTWEVDSVDQAYPPYAIVMTHEMNHTHVHSGPHTPTAAETGLQYANGSYISTILAHWISGLGYTGIAEHTSHYDAVLPPLAVQAGLGEIGRNGYLITPNLGSRVRLSAVLTDLPLVVDDPIDIGVEEFCENCMKCAHTCPSNSIPTDEKKEYQGTMRWKLEIETCSAYWNQVGTDCAICMGICPFSRPDTPLHTVIRWLVKRSWLAPKVFPLMDDLLYGKKWKVKPVPEWLEWE
jgi:reductive dehalogenase